jgi:hypothetical protein
LRRHRRFWAMGARRGEQEQVPDVGAPVCGGAAAVGRIVRKMMQPRFPLPPLAPLPPCNREQAAGSGSGSTSLMWVRVCTLALQPSGGRNHR